MHRNLWLRLLDPDAGSCGRVLHLRRLLLHDDAGLPLLTGLLLARLAGLLLTLDKLLLALLSLLPPLLQSCLLHLLEGVLTGLIVALGTEPARLLQVYGRTRGALLKALDELITWVLLLCLLLLRGEPLLALGLRRLARLHQLLRLLLLLLLLRRLHLRERCWNERGRSQQCRCDDHFHCCLPRNGG